MPTDTSRLDELLGQLAELIGESKDKAREAALKILDNPDTKPIGEVLLKKGLGQRTAAAEDKATEAQAQITKLKDQLEEKNQALVDAEQEVAELKQKEPNWQRRSEEADRKWQSKIEAAEQKAAEERRGRLQDKVEIHRQRFIAELGLGRDGGVEEEWGRDVLPTRYADRFVPDDEGNVRVLEPGETTAYDPADGDPVKQLARDVLAKVPPKYRIMGTPEAGGGTKGGSTKPVTLTTEQVAEQKARTGLYQL